MSTQAEAPARRAGDDEAPRAPVRAYDFRRPDSVLRDQVKRLEVAHEVFARRLGTQIGSLVRAPVQVEPLATDQVSFDEYVRSMPNPTLCGVANFPPLPGTMAAELDAPLSMVLVDRLLGGQASELPGPLERQPTELEAALVASLLRTVFASAAEALSSVVPVRTEPLGMETNPQFVQIAPPSEMVLLLSFRVSLTGAAEPLEGLLTLCYPTSMLTPLLERLATQNASHQESDGVDPTQKPTLGARVPDVSVDMALRLRPSSVSVRDLVSLRPGDVLALEHRTTEPVRGFIGDSEVLLARLGRRGRRLAVEVARWLPPGGLDAEPGDRADDADSTSTSNTNKEEW